MFSQRGRSGPRVRSRIAGGPVDANGVGENVWPVVRQLDKAAAVMHLRVGENVCGVRDQSDAAGQAGSVGPMSGWPRSEDLRQSRHHSLVVNTHAIVDEIWRI